MSLKETRFEIPETDLNTYEYTFITKNSRVRVFRKFLHKGELSNGEEGILFSLKSPYNYREYNRSPTLEDVQNFVNETFGDDEWILKSIEKSNNTNKIANHKRSKPTFRSGNAQAKQIISNMNRISNKTNKKFK